MRVEALQLHDFKSYQDADLDLSGIQLASVVGANGAGKSSLLEAIAFALTGARTMRSLDSFIRQGAEECRVALTFSTGGEIYRLTRSRSSRVSGKSTVELARQDDSGLWAAEGTGARDTEERVRQILGCDEDTLLQTAIVSQGDAGSFFALRPAQRLEALGSILRLDDVYQPLEKHFKGLAEGAKTSLEAARRDVERLEVDVERLADKQGDLVNQQVHVELLTADVRSAETNLAVEREIAGQARDAAAGYELAVAKRDELLKRRDALEGRAGDLNDEAENLRDRITSREDLETELARWGNLEAARALELSHREQDQATAAERQRLDQALTTARARLDEATEEYRQVERRVSRLTSDHGDATGVENRAGHEADEVERRLEAVQGAERPTCDRCGQTVADESLQATIAGLDAEWTAACARHAAAEQTALERLESLQEAQSELEAARDRGRERRQQVESAERELTDLPATTYDPIQLAWVELELLTIAEIPAKLAVIATLEERLAAVAAERESLAVALRAPELVDALTEAEQAVSVAQGARARATEAEAAVRSAEGALAGSRQVLSDAEKAAARLEGEVQSLEPCREALADTTAATKRLEQEQADAELLRKAFSKWGVPALIVGNVLLALEKEVNDLLSLYEGSLALRFESERETRDGARDSLEIIVYDGEDWRPFETFSGGERYRVASAMRLGLAQLLSHRSGARVSTLIVDEPEGLDAPGRAHLARILERMSESFGITLLLTHYDDLKDAMPQQIVVSRGENGLSRVEVVA